MKDKTIIVMLTMFPVAFVFDEGPEGWRLAANRLMVGRARPTYYLLIDESRGALGAVVEVRAQPALDFRLFLTGAGGVVFDLIFAMLA